MATTIKKNARRKEEYKFSKGQTVAIGSAKVTLKDIVVKRLPINPETGLGGDELQATFSVSEGKERTDIFLSSRPGSSSMKTMGGYIFGLNGGSYDGVALVVERVEMEKKFAVGEGDSIKVDGLTIEVSEVVNEMKQDKKENWIVAGRYLTVNVKKDKAKASIRIDEGKSEDWNGYTIFFVGTTDQGTVIKVDKS